MELASRTAPGGALGDTYQGSVVARVFADGEYGFVARSFSTDVFEVVPDQATRRVIGSGDGQAAEGFATRVATNGLLYEVRDGAYVVTDYQIDVATVLIRDGLTELENNQRVRIDSENGRVDTWDGSQWVEGLPETKLYETYAELPNPTTVRVGTTFRVTNDPVDGLNGVQVATGAAPGQNAAYYDSTR